MRIVFIGTVEFSYKALDTLLRNGHEVVAVLTKAESNFNSDFKDLRPLCEMYGVPYKLINNINHPNNVDFIRSFTPDVIYCFGWSQIINSDILKIGKYGVIGFHPALLPHNRGRHPIIWALFLGLSKTGSTFFFMDEGADTGDIVSQEEVFITDSDTAQTLYSRIVEVAIGQIEDFTNELKLGRFIRTAQTEHGNSWRKRGPWDGKIDFRMSSNAIFNLVRALTVPYVGAHILYEGNDYKVWSCIVSEYGSLNDEPGKILYIDDKMIRVKTYDGAVDLIHHELPVASLKENDYL